MSNVVFVAIVVNLIPSIPLLVLGTSKIEWATKETHIYSFIYSVNINNICFHVKSREIIIFSKCNMSVIFEYFVLIERQDSSD